ncbi:hypothetical protein DFH11DRAFT_1749120 [Phellopilus nigrolimitatus]|nr:hypothetical protein DFH11DRAFT_1749120 [Phellopilus nigrolimitatus]
MLERKTCHASCHGASVIQNCHPDSLREQVLLVLEVWRASARLEARPLLSCANIISSQRPARRQCFGTKWTAKAKPVFDGEEHGLLVCKEVDVRANGAAPDAKHRRCLRALTVTGCDGASTRALRVLGEVTATAATAAKFDEVSDGMACVSYGSPVFAGFAGASSSPSQLQSRDQHSDHDFVDRFVGMLQGERSSQDASQPDVGGASRCVAASCARRRAASASESATQWQGGRAEGVG